ncbi:flavin-containing amine oxidoreductase-domain containing protein [Pavlovales sp. CCMP2436]|nr:flavin-containing amine oxidoreductase-domain containing protein [Pavlovales sp. CCMP2436]
MGAYTRVFLAFPHKFWPETQRHILIAHPRRGLYGVVTNVGSDLTRYPPSDAHTLCVTVTGDEARRIELLSDDEVSEEVMQLFGHVWAEQAVPPPLAVHVCRWSTDPLFLGAFSVIPPNALRASQAQKLQVPVGPIYFAGEACHARYSGFLHGAYLSGIEAARSIAASLASNPPERNNASLFKSIAGARRVHSPAAASPGTPGSRTPSRHAATPSGSERGGSAPAWT